MVIFLVIALIIALVAVIFALQNTAVVAIHFLAWGTQGSLALVLLLTLAVGAVICYFALLPTVVKDKWSLRSQRKRLNDAEARLAVQKSRIDELEMRLKTAEAPKPAETPPAAVAGGDALLPPPAQPPV